jgi:predicted RNase H-like HicB family nuclease
MAASTIVESTGVIGFNFDRFFVGHYRIKLLSSLGTFLTVVILMISQTLAQLPGTGLAPKQTYDVLLELQPDGTHQASVLGWVDCYAIGATEEDAIDSLRQVLSDRLTHSKILQLEIPQQSGQPIVESDNPWIKFAGVFKDDPMFDEMLESIAEYRQELDAELDVMDLEQDGML